MSFDFGEVFTVGARHVAPVARRRALKFFFDCRFFNLRLSGTPDGVQGALHRLSLAAISVVRGGSFAISASLVEDAGHAPRLCVRIVAVGSVGSDEEFDGVAGALGLTWLAPDAYPAGSRTAWGTCPHSLGAVSLTKVGNEGALITLDLTSIDNREEDHQARGHAGGASAWLVNGDDVACASWMTRLQRLGWAVSRFDSYGAAAARASTAAGTARPALVIVLETGDPSVDGALTLPELLPAWSRLVYVVETGSPTLRQPGLVSGYEVHVCPMSPQQLHDLTVGALQQELHSGSSEPIPLTTRDMPTLLIVDDAPFNLMVGQGFAEALGYRVVTAFDGLDAIHSCRTHAPNVVLMDYHMPRLNGVETIRRLRQLQREGGIPPFPITVVTAGWTPEIQAECLAAGADECLAKPLSLTDMAAELSRIGSYR